MLGEVIYYGGRFYRIAEYAIDGNLLNIGAREIDEDEASCGQMPIHRGSQNLDQPAAKRAGEDESSQAVS